jgi:hypothetical protein
MSGGLGGGSSGGSSALSGASLTSLASTPTISAPSTTGNQGNTLSTSNFLGPFYGNPYYQGVLSNASTTNQPGGFGAATFGTGSTTSGGGQIGFAGTTGGAAAGGARTAGGGRGVTGNTSSTAYVVNPPVQISYRAVAQIANTPMPSSQLESDVVGMLRRTPSLANTSAIQISVQNDVVTLRGTVMDPNDVGLVQRMVWMTPGVRGVKNELTSVNK